MPGRPIYPAPGSWGYKMLDLMRKHAKSWVINIVIAVIAIVFIFWGVGSWRARGTGRVATVNGDVIGIGEFQESYRRLLDSARDQYKELLDEELLKLLNLKRQALDSLINQHLIYQQAQTLGVDVQEEELQRIIATTPMFQVDGRFDPRRYQAMLSRLHYNPAQYEQMLRQDLITQKMTRLVSSLAKVSPAEALDFFHLIKDRIDVDFVFFPADLYAGQVKIAPEALGAWFDQKKEKYRVPTLVKVEYLSFRPRDFEAEVQIKEDEIAEYYELNRDNYQEQEQVKVRHILFPIDAKAKPEEITAVKNRAETVLARAKDPKEDFANLAKEFSTDASAENGGDLGWIQRDQMVKSFADAAFRLKKDEVSGLVPTQYGLHIIKVEDRRPARMKTLEEVKEEIKAKLVREKTLEIASDRAEKALQEIGLTQDFQATAKKLGLTPQATGYFSAEDTLAELGLEPKFNQVALGLKKGETGPLITQENGFYLARCLDRQESRLPALDEVRGRVESDLTEEKAFKLAEEAAAAFIARAIKEPGWEAAAADFKTAAKPKEPPESGQDKAEKKPEDEAGQRTPVVAADATGPFNRTEAAPKISGAATFNRAAFTLAKVGQISPQPLKGDKGWYALRLKDKLPATNEEFEKDKADVIRSLQSAKAQNCVRTWLQSIRKAAEIKVEEGVI
ncbi:MAG: SurA N-terminal domain-containing protein [Thermodesulfobacteriota bacterium]